MADLSIQDQIKLKRGAFASTTTMRTNRPDDSEDDMTPVFKTGPMTSPPPPPPLPSPSVMKKRTRNDSFDLRPKEMIVEGDSVGKPHISALGEGITLPNISGISAAELQDFKKKLKPIKRHEISIESEDSTATSKETTRVSTRTNERRSETKNRPNEKERQRGQDPQQDDRTVSDDQGDSENKDFRPVHISARNNKGKTRSEFTSMRQELDELISPEDSISQAMFTPATRPAPSRAKSTVSRQSDNMDKGEFKSEVDDDREHRRSIIRTSKHRSPSICFSFPEGDDNISEVSEDDLITDVKQRPAYGSFQFICNELNIREPFTEPELNVLHAMCEEYVQIANLTFAKKKLFVRSLPHEERVYNFLGSRKKSGWLEKADIGRGVMSSKTLEFLFSVTIRRRSRRIEGETLNLKGFTRGRTLTVARFSSIIKDAFTRREYLFNCTVGKLHAYNEIK